jgi:exonuclease-1
MLVHFGITPYLVFDGDHLPSKAGTEKERREKRAEGKRLGSELLKVGKTSQAHLELQKAVDVTPEMARMFIEELKHHNIQYVVAPYEADSQLAYLEKQGIISGILSEDSDLLVFGAKCLITKLDKYGECVEINRNLFTACREVSLVGWSDADFRRMAMLSGCDYLPGIGKMGLKTAHRMLRKHKTVERVVKAAQFDGQLKVPAGYLEAFTQAENTFLYQWVFCPLANQLVNLTPPEKPVNVTAMPYLGKQQPEDVAVGVANGNLHPHTKEPMSVDFRDRSQIKPLRPNARKPAPMQTPDLKHGKPIDSFFKPKRTPLAELDPNLFTPSPSQQQLVEQQRRQSHGGWAAVLAPPSMLPPRPSVTRTAPQPPRRVISESLARASAPHPSKRQRLCSDNSFGTPSSSHASVERSRHFASSMPDPSPSLRTNKSRKKTNSDFELYSDDSFDEAIAEIADLEEAMSQPSKKLTIFKDDFQSSVSSDSQSTIFSRSITSNSQISSLTPATSFGSPPPESTEESVFSDALSSKVKDLRSKFSFNTMSTVETPSQTRSRQKPSPKLPLGAFEREVTSVVPESPERFSKSPLRNGSMQPTTSEENVNDLKDSAWAAMEAEVVVAASEAGSSPLRPLAPQRVEVKGSEDMLIPDSEAESDCSPRKPVLNLGRFAFTG